MAEDTAATSTPDGSAGRWVDLYTVLGLATDTDETALRTRINQLFTEANSNYDHRNMERRRHYHALKDEYLPQCRRVLLVPALRARYDEENAAHQSGGGECEDVAQFLAKYEGQDDGSGEVAALPTATTAGGKPAPPVTEPVAAETPVKPAAKPAPAPKPTAKTSPRMEKELTLEELEDEGAKNGKRGGRALSDTSRLILTAIVAALLTYVIQFANAPKNTAPGRAPLIVAYASELRPIMERAKADFEKSPEGGDTEIVLQQLDSRDGMFSALGQTNTLPDVWIPSESLWSKRYNAVASTHKRRNIDNPAPLAMSPVVLVARRDHSESLLKQFPGRIIGSWDALRTAVATGAPSHLGMTDPTKSGVGATSRYFMARDWCQRNHVPWNSNALKNEALWQWLGGFEDNVPNYEAKSSSMVQDLALGTTSRYWWVLAFESDAINWLQQDKPIEVFYLPQTNYGDHPFCHVPAAGSAAQMNVRGKRLEDFLKTDKMQRLMLSHGFRPLGLDFSSSTEGNPFTNSKITKHGVKLSGFSSTERFDYEILNNLNLQWSGRFNK